MAVIPVAERKLVLTGGTPQPCGAVPELIGLFDLVGISP
jgi:hypothetical protein